MAFRTKKISQMDPKGSNLASTDLLEISQLVSGSYVTKSITGAEIIASAPATAWGTITGTLSSQTDLNTALSGKVPTSRTLTINGTTQDLSADRTFTISTGITIGTTAITSGTVGRVLFEGTGNVVQESANLFWDNTNLRFQVGTSSTTPFGSPLIFMGKDQNGETNFQISNSTNGTGATVGFRVFGANNRSTFLGEFSQGHTGVTEFATNYVIEPNAPNIKHGLIISLPETTTGSDFMIYTGGRNAGNRKLTLFGSTGNLAINTTTDAGFKLDVNGTARVKGTGTTSATTAFTVQNSGATTLMSVRDDSRIIMPVGGGGNVSIGSLNANTNAIDVRGYFPNGSNCGIYIENFNSGTIKTQLGGATNGVVIDLTQTFSNGTRGGIGMIVTGTVNNTGSSVGDVAGYSFAPTITSLTGGSVLYAFNSTVGGAYINTSSRQASSILQADSTTKGFLPPRMTTTQINAIASPAEGLQVYNTTISHMCFYQAGSWVRINHSPM